MNQSRPEEITMKEDLGTITLLNDDGFGGWLLLAVVTNMFTIK